MTDEFRSPFSAVLDAVDGIGYVVERNGNFLDWGRPNWNRFAHENGAPELAEGRNFNLFEACSDPETQAANRTIFNAVWSGAKPSLVFAFRCDSPSMRRELRMAVTRLERNDKPFALLFQAQPISETLRPPIDLFNPDMRRRALQDGPLVAICSYCHDVRFSGTTDWIRPEVYYREGGTSAVRLSHGVCPSCYERIVAPLLPEG